MTEEQRKHWDELKAKHPDALLLFRCGDFYETYNEDAVACSTILGITLTMNKDDGSMAGFPHHDLDSYLPKLIRAGKRVAIYDWPTEPPKRGKRDNENENEKPSETMAKNLKAADLIGKTIEAPEAGAKYVIKSVSEDGTKLVTDYYMKGKDKPFECPITMTLLEANKKAGKWTIEGVTPAAPAAVEEVEEVSDVVVPTPAKTVEMPTQKPQKAQKPKGKANTNGTNDTNKAGRYTFKTYTREKNGHTKTLGRIDGFQEGDEWLERDVAEKLHASAMYDRDDNGGKTWWLSFGKRYVDAGRKVCEALNAGKTIDEMQAIVDAQTDENHRMAEERKIKREERNANADPNGKTYTEQEVADLIRRILSEDEGAIKEAQALMAKAA